jgi:hypothetical protein
LCTSIPAIFIASSSASKRQNAREKVIHLTCYHFCSQGVTRHRLVQNACSLSKLKNSLTSSRVKTDLRRPRSISVHAPLNPIFMSMGGAPGP